MRNTWFATRSYIELDRTQNEADHLAKQQLTHLSPLDTKIISKVSKGQNIYKLKAEGCPGTEK